MPSRGFRVKKKKKKSHVAIKEVAAWHVSSVRAARRRHPGQVSCRKNGPSRGTGTGNPWTAGEVGCSPARQGGRMRTKLRTKCETQLYSEPARCRSALKHFCRRTGNTVFESFPKPNKPNRSFPPANNPWGTYRSKAGDRPRLSRCTPRPCRLRSPDLSPSRKMGKHSL